MVKLFKLGGDTKLPFVVFFFALILNSVIIFHVLPPNFFIKYQVAAEQYLKNTLEPERHLDFSLFYLYFHIISAKIFENPNTFVLSVQILITSFSSVFLFFIIRAFFSSSAAFIATAVFMTHHSLLAYTGTFEPEPFVVFFALGFLWFAILRSSASVFLSGIFLGMSILTRSNFFLLIFITPIYFLLSHSDKKQAMKIVILFEIPVLVVCSILMIKNTIIAGSFTPFNMNPGYVFFEGNNPNSTGESAIYPPLIQDSRSDFPFDSDYRHVLYRLFARRMAGKELSVKEVNAFWSQKAKNFILDNPVHFLKQIKTKIAFMFHDYKRHDIITVYKKEKKIRDVLPAIPPGLIYALSLLGLVFSIKAWKDHLLFYGLLCSQIGIMLLTYVSERQRVAIIGLMVFFAVKAVHDILVERKYRFSVLFLLFAFPLFYLQNDIIKDDIYRLNQSDQYGRLMDQAVELRKEGRLKSASIANALAYAHAPWKSEDVRLATLGFQDKPFEQYALEMALWYKDPSPSRLFDLATFFVINRRFEEAEKIFSYLSIGDYRLNRRFDQSSLPEFYLARIYHLQGRNRKAVHYLKKALEKNPGDPWVLSHLTAQTGNTDYAKKLMRYFGSIDARFFLGKANLASGRYVYAEKDLRYVVERLPEYRKGKVYLSLALGAAGKIVEAAELYINTVRSGNRPLFHEKSVIRLFRQWVDLDPENQLARYHLAMVLKDFGRFGEALDILADLKTGDSFNGRIDDSIKFLENALGNAAGVQITP